MAFFESVDPHRQNVEDEISHLKAQILILRGQLETNSKTLKHFQQNCFKLGTQLRESKNRQLEVAAIKQKHISHVQHFNMKLAAKNNELDSIKNENKNLQDKHLAQESTIRNLDGCVSELKLHANNLKQALRESQRVHKITEQANLDLEKTLSNEQRDNKGLEDYIEMLIFQLQQKQDELDGILQESNAIFDFVQNVSSVIQFPADYNCPPQNQLPELLADLRRKLEVNQNRQLEPESPLPSLAPLPALFPRLPESEFEQGADDDDDQLYDELMSNIMLSIPMPCSPPSPKRLRMDTPAASTSTRMEANREDFYEDIMSDVQQSVAHPEPSTSKKRRHGAKSLPPSLERTSDHYEDTSKRQTEIRGRPKYFCICGKMETSSIRFKNHIEEFNPDRKFPCSICPRRYLNGGHLAKHISLLHTG